MRIVWHLVGWTMAQKGPNNSEQFNFKEKEKLKWNTQIITLLHGAY